MKLTLELEPGEALLILDPIQDKALSMQKLAATSQGEVREIAELTAKVCGRVATMIVDGLYPEANPRRRILEDEIEFGLV